MDGFQYEDIFATKGVEYLLILAFLVLLVLYFRLLNKQAKNTRSEQSSEGKHISLIDFFTISTGYFYHLGHTWIKIDKTEQENSVWVGMDDFAQKLIGEIDEIKLPKPGRELVQGEIGWSIKIENKSLDFISPISGIVNEVNEILIDDPKKIDTNNFSSNWLFKVKVNKLENSVNSLLSGNIATAWLNESVKQLQAEIPTEQWDKFSDENISAKGFLRLIDENKWDSIAKKFIVPSSY